MKTPRDILLNRHQTAAPKLDRLRREVIDQEVRAAPVPEEDLPSIVQSPGDWLQVLWRHALRPWRPAWMGLAVAWLVILGLHLAGNGASGTVSSPSTRLAPTAVAELQEQLKLRAELLGTIPQDRVEPGAPRVGPRSEQTGPEWRSSHRSDGPRPIPGHSTWGPSVALLTV